MRLCDLLLLILTYPSVCHSVLGTNHPSVPLPMGANDFFSARARVLGFLDESDDAMPCIYVLSCPRFVAEWGWEVGTKRSGRGKEGAEKLIFFAE